MDHNLTGTPNPGQYGTDHQHRSVRDTTPTPYVSGKLVSMGHSLAVHFVDYHWPVEVAFTQ